MQKLYTLFLLLSFTSTYAQYDVGVTAIILPDTNQSLAYDFNDFVEIEFTNFGDALQMGDTVVMSASIEVNGVQDPFFILTVPINLPFPTNTSIPIPTPSEIDLTGLLSQFQGQQKQICVTADIITQTDANPNNDSYCHTYTITSAPITGVYDVAVAGIVNPDTTSELAYDYNDTLQVVFANNGDLIDENDTLLVTIEFTDANNDSIITLPLVLGIPANIPNGSALNAGLELDLSSILTNYQGQEVTVCISAELMTQTDDVPGNDTYCYTYTVSSELATSINDLFNQYIESSFFNGSLNIKNNKTGNTVSIYNTNGQLVFNNSNGNSSFNLNLKQGIYIVTISEGSQVLNTNKILVN